MVKIVGVQHFVAIEPFNDNYRDEGIQQKSIFDAGKSTTIIQLLYEYMYIKLHRSLTNYYNWNFI